MARDFNGSTSRLIRADNETFDPQGVTFAAGLRFKKDRIDTTEFLLSKGNFAAADAGWSLLVGGADNRVAVRLADGTNQARCNGPALTDTSDWHTLVMVLDRASNTLYGYLDGVRTGWDAAVSTTAVGSIDPTIALHFGTKFNGSIYTDHFDGVLSEAWLWKGLELPTDAQILDWHNGLVAWHAFNCHHHLVANWPLCGNSLVDLCSASGFTLTDNATTVAADPTLTWEYDPDIAHDTAAFEGASGTAITSLTTTGGRSWSYHALPTGVLQASGSGTLRRASGDGNEAIATLPSVRSRHLRVRCDVEAGTLQSDSGFLLFPNVSTSARTWYGGGWDGTPNYWWLDSRSAGTPTVLATNTTTLPLSAGVTRTVSIEWAGTRLALVVDGRLTCLARPTTATIRDQQGRPGVRVSGSADTTGGFRFGPMTIERGAEFVDLSIGTAGGGSGSVGSVTYAGFHLPIIHQRQEKFLVVVEARGPSGGAVAGVGDNASADIVVFEATNSEAGWATWAYKSRPVASGSGGIAGFHAARNPNLWELENGDLVLLHCDYPSTGGVHYWENTADAGTSGNTGRGFVTTSTDGGATWSARTEVTSQIKDSSWRGFIIGPGRNVRLASGRLVGLASGRLLSGEWESWPIWSDDDGVTWDHGDKIGTAANIYAEASVELAWDNTTLIFNVRASGIFGAQRRIFWTSTDGGETMSGPFEETELPASLSTGAGTNVYTSVKRGWYSGQYLYTGPASWRRARGVLRTSTDFTGATGSWSPYATEATRGKIAGGAIIEFNPFAYSEPLATQTDGEDYAYVVSVGSNELHAENTADFLDRVTVHRVPRSWTGLGAGGATISQRTLAAAALVRQRAMILASLMGRR